MNFGMKSELTKGTIVQFRMDWDAEPTPSNTAIVTRVAKDKSWADITSPYGKKRVPNPQENLKVITKPLVVHIKS